MLIKKLAIIKEPIKLSIEQYSPVPLQVGSPLRINACRAIRCQAVASMRVLCQHINTFGTFKEKLSSRKWFCIEPVEIQIVSLRPLTTEEVQIELRGWFDLLREKTREVRDAELKLEKLAEGASDEELRKQLVASTCNSG